MIVPAIVALVLAAAPASAQDAPQGDERARLHFQSGAAYYDAGEYESALREFESAFALSHRAQLYYNMYLCEQAIGNLETAASHLEHYLAEVPEIENRSTLELRLTNLRERIAQRAAGSPDPGPSEEELAEQRGPTEPQPEAGAEPTEPPPPRQSGPNVGAIAGFSVAALGLVGAAIFGPLTLAEDSSLGASPCGVAHTCTSADTSTMSTYALLTDISFGVALAGAAVGAILLFVLTGDDAAPAERATLHVAPLAGPTTAGVVIGGAL